MYIVFCCIPEIHIKPTEKAKVCQYVCRGSPVVISDTEGVVIVISDEWRALQCAATGSAAETVSMETLAHCFQHPISDSFPTARTNCQRVLHPHIQKTGKENVLSVPTDLAQKLQCMASCK